ncbi:carbohydrate binding domain-containing protein [Stenotrophomonas indicatrix]|uniref:Uncharacterized protein n=1 Tax=Stenotrophomonas indicatrix TaxID=2045451 RepID=A0A1W1H2W3_9GAMM|nr:carbohydrate binding domain-containing protein [Stenotrophomonas indicatrix]SLM25936.1 hypothetical protein SAMN04488690_3691 [Stenotrophomonas indicatrix]
MARKIIDLDSLQPNGKRGETQRPAFTKINDNFAEVYSGLKDAQEAVTAIPAALDAALAGRSLARNFLVNGDFRFWQRGWGLAQGTGSNYLADRWKRDNGNGTLSMARFPLEPGQTAVPGNPRWYMNVNVGASSARNSYQRVSQLIEDVTLLSGRKLTLSFYAKAAPGSKIAVEIEQDFRGQDSSTQMFAGIATLTGTWSRYTMTFDVPSVSGKNTNGAGHCTWVSLWMSTGPDFSNRVPGLGHQTGNFDIAMVQLEDGAAATDFERRPDALELLLCQRYFEKSYNIDVPPGTADGAGRDNQFYDRSVGVGSTSHIRCRVLKRATPAYTVYNDTTGAVSQVSGASGGAGTVTSIVNPGQSGAQVNYVSAPGNWGSSFHWTADAEL